jgi:hypothetical protein
MTVNETTPGKPAFSQYAAFPAYERTKVEILDAYLKQIEDWKTAVKTPNDVTRFKEAVFSLIQWYVLVHGYTKVKPTKDLDKLKGGLDRLHEIVKGGRNIDALFTLKDLNEFQLAASVYMNELGITSILQHHRKDQVYIADGM